MTTEVSTRPIMENNQALQTALELSMLNLTNSTVIDSPDSYGSAVFGPPGGELDSPCLPRTPRSMNVTQCVAVPSSEHVAEIVGRQGLYAVKERKLLCFEKKERERELVVITFVVITANCERNGPMGLF